MFYDFRNHNKCSSLNHPNSQYHNPKYNEITIYSQHNLRGWSNSLYLKQPPYCSSVDIGLLPRLTVKRILSKVSNGASEKADWVWISWRATRQGLLRLLMENKFRKNGGLHCNFLGLESWRLNLSETTSSQIIINQV